jgi:hypothetical protein
MLELCCELKKRKKLEPTSIALPAASASSIQSRRGDAFASVCGRPIALEQHQHRPNFPPDCPSVHTRIVHNMAVIRRGHEYSAVGGPVVLPSATSVSDKSTDEACIVQVPGTGLFGSGHCVVMAGFTFAFQASGRTPKSEINFAPSAGPQKLHPACRQLGRASRRSGFWSLSNRGIST